MRAQRPPHPVRLAVRLMQVAAVLAALMVVVAIIALLHLSDARVAYEQSLDLDDTSAVGSLNWGFSFTLVIALASAVAAAFLANKLRFPSRPAQLSSWVVTVVVVLGVGCGLTGDPSATLGAATGSAETALLEKALVPGWYGSTNTLLALLLLGCLLAQSVLLFRPAAQSFYHLGDWEEVPEAALPG